MSVLWPYRPNGAVLERLEWLTDVLESDNGTEQRRRSRETPRRSFEYDFLLDERDRRAAENALYSAQASEILVPVWMDAESLESAASAAATTLPVTPDTRDYTAGNSIALISAGDPQNHEIAVIDTVGGSSITLTAGLAATWPAGTILVPLRPARLSDAISLARFTGASAYGRTRFACTDTSSYASASESTYRSYPVMTRRPNWSTDIGQDYQRKTRRVDSGIGAPSVTDFWSGPALLQRHTWLCDGRSEIDTLRQWLFARSGRLTAFWEPSWSIDLVPVATIGSGDTTIDVEHCGYSTHVAQALGRRDIRIETNAGTVYYRRISASAEVDATTERLTISSALGAAVEVADVYSISYLRLARLDADAVEIAWHRWDVAECAFVTRGIRNDL